MEGMMARSLLQLVRFTFRRQLTSKKTAVALVFLAIIALLLVVVGIAQPWRPDAFGKRVVLQLLGTFFVPVAALAYGTGALGDDRDEKSLVYLLARPIPRSGIYLGKFLAVTPVALLLNLGGLWALSALSEVGWLTGHAAPRGAFAAFWPAVLWATLAYLSLFHLFVVLFRHSTAIAVAYVFFVEVFIGRMPGILKRVSIHFYFNCLAYEAGDPLGVRLSREEAKRFLPIDGSAARLVLIVAACALLLSGAVIFARREYRDAG